MLSIGKIALGQHRYYEQQVAGGDDDYYSGRGEAPGEWIGRRARALGLAGRVRGDQFSALLAGRDPRDLRSHLRRARGTIPRVAALDLTFSAPKSVSVLAAVGDDELTRELIVAHEEALRAALEYLEDTAVQVRRGAGGTHVKRGDGLIAAAYRHRMSRALDPQLHTHVVAANMTRGPDGRYTALHGTPLYRAAKTAGYLYQSHLRAVTTERLGLAWGRVHNGAADLEAVPFAVLEEFSKRRRAMLREAEAGGISLGSKTAAEKAAIATRDRKQYGIDTHTWREEVRARAAELGLGRLEVALLIGGAPEGGRDSIDGDADEQALADRLAGPTGLTERTNTFHERDVLQAFADASQSGTLVGDLRGLAKRFAQRPDVIETPSGDMTTAELVGCERRLIGSAIDRADAKHRVDPALTERAFAAAVQSLTAEQVSAVHAITTSAHGVSVVEARAGAGKTYIAAALRAIYERAGFQVIGVAPTARAARELEEQARIPSRTLDRLLLDTDHLGERIPTNSVVILDEAGMAPTRLSARLLADAQDARAKVIAIGDPLQLPSVQAGGWLRAVGRACGAVRLTQVMRQRDARERAALAALRDRQPERYLKWAKAAGRIETLTDATDAARRTIELWHQAVTATRPGDVVMIARDNDTRDDLNAAARDLWGALGLLGEERTYGALSLAVGDRIICRHNDAGLDVDNGMRGLVRALDSHCAVIETDAGSVRELPAAYVDEHIEHAYALTGHSMQGGTVERAIVVASPRDLTAGWSYTTLSRARGETRLLVYSHGTADERNEFAPAEQTRTGSKDLLARVERHMRERDDEDLAIEQLPFRPDEIELATAPTTGRPTHENTTRRALQRIEDLDRRALRLTTQRACLTQRLERLPQCRERSRRGPNPHTTERVHLDVALRDCAQQLALVLNARTLLVRELGDPIEVGPERDGLERAISGVDIEDSERRLGRDVGAERDVDRGIGF
jgi:conjugative relaxase-like TrwC/TraI family protein